MPQPRSAARSAAALVSLALLGGCVAAKEPTVGVTNLKSDIVFGVEEAATATPAALPDDLPSVEEAAGDLDIPASFFATPEFQSAAPAEPRVRPGPTTPVRKECPDAPLNAFPERRTSENLPMDVLPLPGDYRFKKRGTVKPTSLPFLIPVDGFERRQIRNVTVITKLAPGTKTNLNPDGYRVKFTYEVVQPKVDGNGTTVTTYQVFTYGATGELSVTNPTGNNVNYREPEAGVTIKKIVDFDRDGKQTGKFEPVQGLLIMPLGVRYGERFQSATVDPNTGQSYQLQGQIIEPRRVDACGVITEGWAVETTIALSGPKSGTLEYNFILSTNLGGIVIQEAANTTTPEGTFNLDYSIGQLVPDPPQA